jgi:hypothetical protein
MLLAGAPIPLPKFCDLLVTIMIVGTDGMAATVHFAYYDYAPAAPYNSRLVLLDFDYTPLAADTVPRAFEQIAELMSAIGRVPAGASFNVPAPLVEHVRQAGYRADAIPDSLLNDPATLAMSCAGFIASGGMKICERAADRSQTIPLDGALDFRGGERIDENPLRLATLVGIAMAIG